MHKKILNTVRWVNVFRYLPALTTGVHLWQQRSKLKYYKDVGLLCCVCPLSVCSLTGSQHSPLMYPPARSLLPSLVHSAAGPVTLPTRSHTAQRKLLYHIANLLSGLLKVWEAFYTYKWYIVLANSLHTHTHWTLPRIITNLSAFELLLLKVWKASFLKVLCISWAAAAASGFAL